MALQDMLLDPTTFEAKTPQERALAKDIILEATQFRQSFEALLAQLSAYDSSEANMLMNAALEKMDILNNSLTLHKEVRPPAEYLSYSQAAVEHYCGTHWSSGCPSASRETEPGRRQSVGHSISLSMSWNYLQMLKKQLQGQRPARTHSAPKADAQQAPQTAAPQRPAEPDFGGLLELQPGLEAANQPAQVNLAMSQLSKQHSCKPCQCTAGKQGAAFDTALLT